jgi:branched-chain amino acid transport system ATP-binding protein
VSALLDVRGVSRRFGGLMAVCDVSFQMARGEIFGVIGPNGAGKTTLFNVIAGHHRPSGGSIVFDGQAIAGRRSDEIARLGIARTFQAVHVFKDETVAENLRRARTLATCHSPLAWFRSRSKEQASGVEVMEDVAGFLGLTGVMNQVAGGLAYGIQKVLGIGMAMMPGPKLMLMDEPAAGLNPSEKHAAAGLIRRLRDERGIDVLLVEHDMPLVMGVCDRILVVNQGRPIAVGTPAVIKADQAVIDAYLGADYEFA